MKSENAFLKTLAARQMSYKPVIDY